MKIAAMKYLTFLKHVRYAVFALVLACAVIVTASVWHSSAVRFSDKATLKRQFHARIRDGVGREVGLAKRGDSSGQIRVAVNSVVNFIEKRSGIKLSEETKSRLAAMEERTQNGAGRRLATNELGDVINATILGRLSTLSDQEIAYVDDTLRGFNAPDLPKNFDRTFELPGGIVLIGIPSEKTVARLKAVRDQLGTPAGEVFEGMARKVVRERVQNRAQYLSEAVPEQFGNMWDVSNNRESSIADGGITPLQAFLIAYSLASDDYLSDSQDSLNKRMRGHQASLVEACGKYPSPAGHYAYGVNGYLFSSPLDLMFDEQTVNRLLDRIEERSAK
ncbi:MAG: hypothetical protein QOJ02_678 [Acidobacteriota bacterium]|jgi:hypothetical protein|nr:hypothetical protein [Acidobacteriota bacterium]